MISGLPMEEMLWNLGLRNLIGLFRNLEWLCEMKMEEIRGLNMDLNDGWHFRKFPGIRKLIPRLQKWKMNLQNGTRVPGGTFAGYENFRKLNSGFANLSFEDFTSWPPIFTSWNFNLQKFS